MRGLKIVWSYRHKGNIVIGLVDVVLELLTFWAL
jgi:hypothetical protein